MLLREEVKYFSKYFVIKSFIEFKMKTKILIIYFVLSFLNHAMQCEECVKDMKYVRIHYTMNHNHLYFKSDCDWYQQLSYHNVPVSLGELRDRAETDNLKLSFCFWQIFLAFTTWLMIYSSKSDKNVKLIEILMCN